MKDLMQSYRDIFNVLYISNFRAIIYFIIIYKRDTHTQALSRDCPTEVCRKSINISKWLKTLTVVMQSKNRVKYFQCHSPSSIMSTQLQRKLQDSPHSNLDRGIYKTSRILFQYLECAA